MKKTLFMFLTLCILMLFSSCAGGDDSTAIEPSSDPNVSAEPVPSTEDRQQPDPNIPVETVPAITPTPEPTPIPTPKLKTVSSFTKSQEGYWFLDNNNIKGVVMIHDDNKAIYHITILHDGGDKWYQAYGELTFKNGTGSSVALTETGYTCYVTMSLFSSNGVDILTANDIILTTPDTVYYETSITNIYEYLDIGLRKIEDEELNSFVGIYDFYEGGKDFVNWQAPSYLCREETEVILFNGSDKTEIIRVDSITLPSGVELKNIGIKYNRIIATLFDPTKQAGEICYAYIRCYIDGVVKDDVFISYPTIFNSSGTTSINFDIIYGYDDTKNFMEDVDGLVIGIVSLDEGIWGHYSYDSIYYY